MSNLKEILINKNKACISIWFMRQAGRYLPEFRKIREKNTNFISLCLNSKLSSEITLQPIERYDLDSAIIFSDILIIPHAIGQKVHFKKNFGPTLDKFDLEKFQKESLNNYIDNLQPIYKAISLTREKLHKDKSLIGFAGAPWTLLVYMLNLKNNADVMDFKKINLSEKNLKLIFKKLNKLICLHIENQFKAGADVIQIFDSWAGKIPLNKLDSYCFEPHKEISDFCKLKKIPLICFPKGIGKRYCEFNKIVKPNGLNIDYEIDPVWAAKNLKNVTIQGGMDPKYLLSPDYELVTEAKKYLDAFKDVPYIFNLGHGLKPETKPEKLKKLINFVRDYK
tara:strand:+ start:2326 stop:3336 length:1011 start_codon:yes stop_codon:yes gene_type:complete